MYMYYLPKTHELNGNVLFWFFEEAWEWGLGMRLGNEPSLHFAEKTLEYCRRPLQVINSAYRNQKHNFMMWQLYNIAPPTL